MPAKPIGVFTSELGGYYFGGMLSGIHQVAREAGVPLILIRQALRDQQFPIFSSDAIAGWIVVHPIVEDRERLAILCAGKAPVVALPVPLDGANCTMVQFDNRGGMRAAVLHLIDHGHQRIAYVDHGPYTWSEERYRGYCDALAERGIALDPALVIRMQTEAAKPDGTDIHLLRGEHAIQLLLERGLPCTALVAPTDMCALNAMRAFQAAGYHVPADLAVVGFDDIIEAQYANPPLTSVRSHFDGLGRAAAEQLLAQIRDGRPAQAQVISVPTTVLQRSSCGCAALDQRLDEVARTDTARDSWQATLTRQLVQVARYPLPLDPAIPPAQLWPGAGTLVAALDTVLKGEQPVYAGIEAAWEQAIAQTENLEALHAALMLLEDTAEQRLDGARRRPALMELMRRMRLEMMRARLAHEVAPKQQLADQVRSNTAVSMALLGSTQAETQSLAWLSQTPATWGCLGLWDDAPAGASALRIAGVYQRGAEPTVSVGQRVGVPAFPPLEQLPASARQGHELTILFPVRAQARDWGILALCGWGNAALTVGADNLMILATLLGAALDRNGVLSALTEQQATLHAAYDRERMLSQTIREIGCPIIPLLPGMLLVPLIGAIDTERAQQIIGTVLMAIGEHRAQTILLDVTGVPVVDTQVAASLIQTTQAATLLGARVVMVGIRPEIAQSIVGLGIDLQQLTIYSTLASALSMLKPERGAR